MNAAEVRITVCDDRRDREQVVDLWKEVLGYDTPHNDPELAIDKKLRVADGLFFVATGHERVVGTVMAGYDGHRGWIHSLAVGPDFRNAGIGTALLRHAEQKLSGLGCVKINLQILEENKGVESFYRTRGYATERRISIGKRLSENLCQSERPKR